MAGRAVNLLVIGVFHRTRSLDHIMTIFAAYLFAVWAVTRQTFPAGMRLVSAHFFNDFKTMLPFMAMLT
jgi:hypothetical protein